MLVGVFVAVNVGVIVGVLVAVGVGVLVPSGAGAMAIVNSEREEFTFVHV